MNQTKICDIFSLEKGRETIKKETAKRMKGIFTNEGDLRGGSETRRLPIRRCFLTTLVKLY